jgi:hypothetical protein
VTEPQPPEPELTDADAAELVAFLDGRVDPARAAELQARAAGDPALAAALDRRRRLIGIVDAAVADTQAPHDLRLRVDALGARAPVRRRARRLRLPLAALAAVAGAAVLAVVLAAGNGLTVRDTLAVAIRPPVAAVGIDPRQPRLLKERVDEVRFPNLQPKFGWRAAGVRTDEVRGRRMRTVFYAKGGRRIAYTVVAGDALDQPGDARRTVAGGVELRTLRADGRVVVTWRRLGGRACSPLPASTRRRCANLPPGKARARSASRPSGPGLSSPGTGPPRSRVRRRSLQGRSREARRGSRHCRASVRGRARSTSPTPPRRPDRTVTDSSDLTVTRPSALTRTDPGCRIRGFATAGRFLGDPTPRPLR